MSKHYDPIMCMMVEDKAKVKDNKASDSGINSIIDTWSKLNKAHEANMPNSSTMVLGAGRLYSENEKEAIRFMARQFGIPIPSDCKAGIYRKANTNDADPRELKALEEVKKLYSNIQNSNDVLHDFAVIKQTANSVKDPKIKAEIMKYVNSMASKLKGLTHDKKTVDAYPQLRKINTPLGTSYRVDSALGSDWIQIDGHADGKFDVIIWGEYKRPSMSPTVKKTGMSEQNAILLAKSYMSNANVHDNKVIDASSIDEFKKTKALCQQIISQYSGTMLGRKVDAHAVITYANSIIEKMDFYIQNSSKGWYD